MTDILIDEIILFIPIIITLYWMTYLILLQDDKIDKDTMSENENFFFIFIVIIFNIIISISSTFFSHIKWKFPRMLDAFLLDFFRRFILLFLLFGFIFMIYQIAKYKQNKINKLVTVLFVTFLIFLSPFSFTILRNTIEDLNYISFEEGVIGGCYIWDNISQNGTGYQKIHLVLMKAHDRWKAPYPTRFLLEFNESTYTNCKLTMIDWGEDTYPIVNYSNNNSFVLVKWSENDLLKQKGYTPNWWIDFVFTWDSDNGTIAKPEKYEILVEYDGWMDVCKGILYHNPNEPDWSSFCWWEQIYEYINYGYYKE